MTQDMMTLRALLEKTLPMPICFARSIGFTAERLMALECRGPDRLPLTASARRIVSPTATADRDRSWETRKPARSS